MLMVKIVVGLGYGDEGKGATVDYLTRQAEGETLVIRYNGGPQAAHNVVTDSGIQHTFAQYGSGTLAGAGTYLSEHMLINPGNLLRERKHLIDECNIDSHRLDTRMYINADAKVILPWHIGVNQAKEKLRGDSRHGSCGQGVGECMKEADSHRQFTIGQFQTHDRKKLKSQLERYEWMRIKMLDAAGIDLEVSDIDAFLDEMEECLDVVEVVGGSDIDWLFDTDRTNLIFEGAQGTLLDQDHGWFPFVTYSKANVDNAFDIIDKSSNSNKLVNEVKVMGITRAYQTRHGAGPFPTEVIGGAENGVDPCGHNGADPWQGEFRTGHLDLPMLRYAALACHNLDEIAVTCLDQVVFPTFVANEYMHNDVPLRFSPQERPVDLDRRRELTGKLLDGTYDFAGIKIETEQELLKVISEAAFAPVTLTSYGPTAEDRHPARSLASA